jgi:hypothetical protein
MRSAFPRPCAPPGGTARRRAAGRSASPSGRRRRSAEYDRHIAAVAVEYAFVRLSIGFQRYISGGNMWRPESSAPRSMGIMPPNL